MQGPTGSALIDTPATNLLFLHHIDAYQVHCHGETGEEVQTARAHRKIQLNWIPTVSWPYKPFCSGYLQYPGHTSHFALEPKYHVARTFNSKQMHFTDPAKPESDLTSWKLLFHR